MPSMLFWKFKTLSGKEEEANGFIIKRARHVGSILLHSLYACVCAHAHMDELGKDCRVCYPEALTGNHMPYWAVIEGVEEVLAVAQLQTAACEAPWSAVAPIAHCNRRNH